MTEKRITQAPPPPTPLSGRGDTDLSFQIARERREQAIADTYEQPNWSHWRVRTHLTTFQAAALSLDVDPGSVHSEKHLTREFRGRLDAIRNCRDLLKGSRGEMGADGWPITRMDVFAAWLVSIKWVVPEELKELAKKASADPPSSVLPTNMVRETLAEIQQAYDELRRKSMRVSQTAVANKANKARSTVQRYWPYVKKG